LLPATTRVATVAHRCCCISNAASVSPATAVANGGATPVCTNGRRHIVVDRCATRRRLLHRRPNSGFSGNSMTGFSGEATMGLSGDATTEDHRRRCCRCVRCKSHVRTELSDPNHGCVIFFFLLLRVRLTGLNGSDGQILRLGTRGIGRSDPPGDAQYCPLRYCRMLYSSSFLL
jgi:hypothetical protein